MAMRYAQVILVAAFDTPARDAVLTGLMVDLPRTALVSYRVELAAGLRRLVSDDRGLVYDDLIPLDHDCVSCTVRRDVKEALPVLTDRGDWDTLLVSPPGVVSMVPLAGDLATDHATDANLAAVVTLVDLANLQTDLLGDDLLDERGLALDEHDRRSVGEVLAEQIEFADLVVAMSDGTTTDAILLRHLVSDSSEIVLDWTELDAQSLLNRSHDHQLAQSRIDLLRVRTDRLRHDDPVWTIALETPSPLDPGQLLAAIESLAAGKIRARGHFWLSSRPDSACVWDASGGQLSIGVAGSWEEEIPRTRLVVTGVDAQERHRIVGAFDQVVRASQRARLDRDNREGDGFEAWLGMLES